MLPGRRAARLPARTRYIAGVATGVAVLYTAFVLANTIVVGPDTRVPLPGLAAWLYLQDALDIVAACLLIAAGAALLDRLLARDQAVQTATLRGMARVRALAASIAATGEFRARVPGEDAHSPGANGGVPQDRTPPAVAELAGTFNAMLARLEQSFNAQRRLLADTSHELRNPLTVLRTNLALLQREDADAHLRLEAAREADEEAARLGRLVDDLLLLARGEAGETIRRQPVRLDQLLLAAAAEARDAGTEHQVEVATEPDVEVLGDAERLRQVLRNAIGNALRHTPPGTQIRLSLQVESGVARVVVDDDGPGIAPEHLPHVFDRFYRADTARSRSTAGETAGGSSGAGLGLAIAKHLVEAHDGTIGVESAHGRGTRVQIHIPMTRR